MKFTTIGLASFLILSLILLVDLTYSDIFADAQEQEAIRQKAMEAQTELITPKSTKDTTQNPEPIDEHLTLKETINDKSNNSVDNVKIKAQFNFDQKTKIIDSFKVFKQKSGFQKDEPVFTLQGVVSADKSFLYRAADSEFNLGTGAMGASQKFGNFDAVISLEQGDFPIRKFNYLDCTITNYWVDTLYDNDYSYNKASAFVLVDNFEIHCLGFQPYHYNYEKYIEKDGVDGLLEMKGVKMKEMREDFYSQR